MITFNEYLNESDQLKLQTLNNKIKSLQVVIKGNLEKLKDIQKSGDTKKVQNIKDTIEIARLNLKIVQLQINIEKRK